jgi:MFS transporter, FHS family, glucose/mannose:H+ symporter
MGEYQKGGFNTLKIRSNIILWGNFYSFMVMGMIVLSFGAIMPYMRATYHLSYEQGGSLLALLAAGNLIFGFLGGSLSDRIGLKRILILGNAFFVVGMCTIGLSQSTAMLLAGVFIAGAGWGTCNTIINLIVNDYVHGDGKIMSLLHMTFGFGAVAIPILSGIMIHQGLPWQSVMLVLAVAAAIGLIFATRMPVDSTQKEGQTQKVSVKSIMKNWQLYVFMAILFFYVGSESAFNGWLVTYLVNGLGFSQVLAQNILSIMWVVIIVGRYINSILSQKFKKEDIILVSSIGSLLMVLLFINVKSPVMVIVAIALMSSMFSGIYPLTIANANPIIKGSGTAGAMITSCGGLGAAVIPYISGRVAEKSGVMGMITTILVSLVFLTVFAVLNKRKQM